MKIILFTTDIRVSDRIYFRKSDKELSQKNEKYILNCV